MERNEKWQIAVLLAVLLGLTVCSYFAGYEAGQTRVYKLYVNQ